MIRSFCIFALLLVGQFPLLAGYVGYLFPAGGQAGTTVDVLIGGTRLNNISGIIIDGDTGNQDIVIENIEHIPSMRVFQYKEQRKYVTDCVTAFFKGNPPPDEPKDAQSWDTKKPYWYKIGQLTPTQMDFVLMGLYDKYDPLQASPSLNQRALIRLKIAANAKAGRRELRFIGSQKSPMLCNPVPFYVSGTAEFFQPHRVPPFMKTPIPEITAPCAINGQIMPAETDYYHFQGKKGEKLSFQLLGRSLLPFIGDGVPGHFQAIMQIRDASNKEVAYQDDTYFDPDPILNFTVPEDGQYTLVVQDALFRGREDFVYRIHVSREHLQYRLASRPEWKLTWIEASSDKATQEVPFPSAVAGTILPKSSQRFSFKLKKDTTAILEIWARRSLSPLDSIIKLYDESGRELANSDDFARPKIGTTYHHADSYLRFTAPQDGTYTVEVKDATDAGGKDYRYWLRIDTAHPDFRVWSIPSGLEVPPSNGTAIVGFVVERLDGHRGDITIDVKDSKLFAFAGSNVIPDGPKSANTFESVCGLQVAFPDCTRNFLTLKMVKGSKERYHALKLQAKSGKITHDVQPADESMQAFAYNHLIESRELRTVASWSKTGQFAWGNGTGTYIALRAGNEILLKVVKNEKDVTQPCTAELHEPPLGFSLVECKDTGEALWLRMKAEANMAARRFNQIVKINFVRKNKRQVILPAIMIEVVNGK